MTQLSRSIVYIIILALVLLLAWLGTPNRDYSPHGLLLPTSNKIHGAISADLVTVANDPVPMGTPIGTIHVEAYAPQVTDDKVAAVERYAVELAAANGANHISVAGIFRNPADKTINLFGKAVQR